MRRRAWPTSGRALSRLDQLSALPDDVLIRLLATAPAEAIAALACVAKRYADVCERAGWACAARRFGRRTNAPFGGGAHWTALAWVPRDATWCPFDEGAFDATGAPPPAISPTRSSGRSFRRLAPDSIECLALEAVLCHGRVMRDPDGVLDDRAVGPELVLTGSVKGAWRAWRMAIASASVLWARSGRAWSSSTRGRGRVLMVSQGDEGSGPRAGTPKIGTRPSRPPCKHHPCQLATTLPRQKALSDVRHGRPLASRRGRFLLDQRDIMVPEGVSSDKFY